MLGNQANVGIGTSAPTARLEVVSESQDASGLRLTNLTSNSQPTQSTDQFLSVNERGDVVKARYRLRIHGVHEWSDRIFAPSYRLTPLAEVERYVTANQHLPNVPSAAEVVKEGVDLVNMNATLLEKIEELTLYSIELEKKAGQQEAVNRQLRSEVDELKQLVNQLLAKK